MSKKQYCLYIFFVIGFCYFSFQVMAYGISPILIEEHSMLPGSVIEKEVTLFKATGDDHSFVKVLRQDDELSSWITTEEGDSFLFPLDEDKLKVRVIITVPKYAKLGQYSSILLFSLLSNAHLEDGQGGSMNIEVRLPLMINISVTDKSVRTYGIEKADISKTRRYKPIVISLLVRNNGNVHAFPETISVDILDELKTSSIYSYTFAAKEEDYAEPFSDKTVKLIMPNKLGVGNYWMRFNISDKELYKQPDDAVLQITPPHSFDFFMQPFVLTIILSVVCTIIVGMIAIILVFKKRSKLF